MTGSLNFHLTERIGDSVLAHGADWTRRHLSRTMPAWQVGFWFQSAPVRRAVQARQCYERLTGCFT